MKCDYVQARKDGSHGARWHRPLILRGLELSLPERESKARGVLQHKD